MDAQALLVIVVFAVAFWFPLLATFGQRSGSSSATVQAAFAALMDEVHASRGGFWPSMSGVLGGRAASLRASFGGWVFALETRAVGGIPSATQIAGLAGAEEFAAIVAELREDWNRAKLRLRGGRLELTFALDVLSDRERLERCLPLMRRAMELLERFSQFEHQVERMRCPYCHDALLGEEALVYCSACQPPHHETCYAESGCTLLGCRERGSARQRA